MSTYRRTDSKHRSRGHWGEERASAKAVQDANTPKPARRPKAAKSPEHLAVLACADKMRQMRLRGEVVTQELRQEYQTLLMAHMRTVAA